MANGNFGGGNGTQANPYLVEDALDFYAIFTKDLSAHYKQVKDISFSGHDHVSNINVDSIFVGSYDGGNFKITGLNVSSTESYIGLFRRVGYAAVFKNINIVNCYLSGAFAVGGIVGGLNESIKYTDIKFYNCKVSGNLYNSGTGTGGILGDTNSHGVIFHNCEFRGSLSGSGYIGGIIGKHHNSYESRYCTLKYCNAEATISSTSGDYVGGLGGHIYMSTSNKNEFFGNYFKGTINVENGNYVGGLLGIDGSATYTNRIDNCYAIATINALNSTNVGGLVGYSYSNINTCYFAGSVSGDARVGGLVGTHYKGSIKNCFGFTTRITKRFLSTSTNFGDIVGYIMNANSPVGTGSYNVEFVLGG